MYNEDSGPTSVSPRDKNKTIFITFYPQTGKIAALRTGVTIVTHMYLVNSGVHLESTFRNTGVHNVCAKHILKSVLSGMQTRLSRDVLTTSFRRLGKALVE